MKLEIECSWNEKKNQGKMTVVFDQSPKTLFAMSKQEVLDLQRASQVAANGGPIEGVKQAYEKHPKSLYAAHSYFQALNCHNRENEAFELFAQIKARFPKELITRCIEGAYALRERNYEEFKRLFKGLEVLKPLFPARKFFYFEEALLFHNLWVKFYMDAQNQPQCEKHMRFLQLIVNSYKTYRLS